MSLSTQSKQETIAKYQSNAADTGSTEVQVALLTARINMLASHFKAHPKDHHSRRGLLKMVSSRKRLLQHMKKRRHQEYLQFIESLGLRK